VTADRVFTSVVERRLNAEKPLGAATRFDVVNSGIGNYNTYFQNRLFHRQYPLIKPDVVVLNYFVSDVEPRGKGRNSPILKYSTLAAYFFDRVATLRFSLDKTFRLIAHYEALYTDDSVPWKQTQEQIADMHDTAARDGVPFLIAVIPDIHDLSRGGPYGALYSKIERRFLAMNIPTVNMFGAFQDKFGDDVSRLWVQRDDPHPNELGHALIADELYRFFLAQPVFRGESQ
jgi:lysophospholipase L1-like esterase